MARLLFLCLLLGAYPVGAVPRPPIQVKVTPAFSQAPHELHILVKVDPNPANRRLYVVTESENSYESSVRQFEGKDDPISWEFYVTAKIPGHYTITALLWRPGFKDVQDAATVCVAGFDVTCD